MDKKNKFLNTIRPSRIRKKQSFFLLFIVLIVLVFLFFASWLCYSNKDTFLNLFEHFGFVGENITIDGQDFQKIGYGPALDDTVLRFGYSGNGPWLSDSNIIPYINHEGVELYLTGDEFRAINGFIPPSFEYFPYGINNPQKDYRPQDPDFSPNDFRFESSGIDEGRATCLQACKDTGCIAVQTEVPQNCYDKRTTKPVPKGLEVVGNSDAKFMVSKGDCKGKATHGCTLFYQNISDADDAYYTLAGGKDFNDPLKPLKVGQKYYEMNKLPEISPNISLSPSLGEVKFCEPHIKVGDRTAGSNSTVNIPRSTRYKTVVPENPEVGQVPSCDCTDINCTDTLCCTCLPKYDGDTLVQPAPLECDDPKCCLYRELLTSKFAKHNTPYYNLPLNLTKTKALENNTIDGLCKARVAGNNSNSYLNIFDWFSNPSTDEDPLCCGWCKQTDGSYKLISCPQTKQFIYQDYKSSNGAPTNDQTYWHIDTNNCVVDRSGLGGVVDDFADWMSSASNGLDDDACIANYQNLYDSDKEAAYDALTQCCTFLDQSCQTVTVQPFCRTSSSNTVERGCYSDPPILNVDNVQGNIVPADTNLIPGSKRCVQDVDGKLCNKGFPYGVSDRSGPLWKPV